MMILSELKEIEVGPSSVFSIEVLLAPVFEAQAFVHVVGWRVRRKGIKADGLHAVLPGKADGLSHHLRADTRALAVGMDGEDMDDGHLVVGHLL